MSTIMTKRNWTAWFSIFADKQCIRIKPDNADAHYNRGITYTDSGMYKEAIEAYKQAISLKADDADAYNNLGVAYLRLSDIGMALEQYEILLRLDSCKAKILHELINK